MTTDRCGIYVHIPFCNRKCNYCDFCSYPICEADDIQAYIAALVKEMQKYNRHEKIHADTLYFGGGTPSLLSVSQLENILTSLASVFDFSEELEFTLEANPGTLTEEKALGYKSLGVNRISLGLQSIHENEMKILGRVHSFSEFLNSYGILRKVGFNNIGVDLMYGIPEQTVLSFRETLRNVADLNPEHISVYGLIIEEGTPFYTIRDKLALPDEDTECDMYYMACDALSERGYKHYEISNYAKAGYESKHNLKYWRGEKYIGIGAAAYSYFEGARYGNIRNLAEYLKGADIDSYERIDLSAERYEYAMMRLRLSEGFPLADYERRFGISFLDGRIEKLLDYCRAGLMTLSGGHIALTERGFYVSNAILSEIL